MELMVNPTPQELAQRVLDQIIMFPETHDNKSWASECGSTYCVAGMAQLFVRGEVVLEPNRHIPHVSDDAEELLGLSESDAKILFHGVSNCQAYAALGFLAEGRQINWDDIWDHHPSSTHNILEDCPEFCEDILEG